MSVSTPVVDAEAQCCQNHTLAASCASSNLTKSRWCIANDAPNGFGTATLPTAFCSFGEQVVTTLEQVFDIQAPSVFEFDLMTCMSNGRSGCTSGQSTGGAQTPTDCGTFGNSVTFDAFTGNAYGATGFWGYLLSLHEAINQWTGLASGGWPTDWWADHQSAFPNLMDFHIMNLIGTTNNDSNLLTAATAQKMRFYPGGDTADPKVVALDNVYGMMPNMDGLAGFSHVFSMVKGDGMSWSSLGPNPNQKLSEYVLAYMGLAVGQNGGQVLKTVRGPSANGGGNICNNIPDGTAGDTPYTCSESEIDAIATAHCAIAANGNPPADVSSLQQGNYSSVAMGPCGSTCPAECGCDMSTMNCVAQWLAMNGGSSSSGSSSGASSGGSSGSSASSGSASGGSSGSASSTSSGAGTGSTSGGGSTTSGSTSGAGSTTSGSTSSGGSGSGTSGSGAASSGSGSGSGDTGPFAGPSSGCACHAPGERGGDSRGPGLWAALALAGLAVVRGRAHRR